MLLKPFARYLCQLSLPNITFLWQITGSLSQDLNFESKFKPVFQYVFGSTLVVDNIEVARFQADLSFKMMATREEVQEEIDNQLMSDF